MLSRRRTREFIVKDNSYDDKSLNAFIHETQDNHSILQDLKYFITMFLKIRFLEKELYQLKKMNLFLLQLI